MWEFSHTEPTEFTEKFFYKKTNDSDLKITNPQNLSQTTSRRLARWERRKENGERRNGERGADERLAEPRQAGTVKRVPFCGFQRQRELTTR